MAKRIAKLTAAADDTHDSRPTQEEIAARAYAYYESEGKMEGRDAEYWFRAEADLMAERQNGHAKSSPRASSRGRRASANPRNN